MSEPIEGAAEAGAEDAVLETQDDVVETPGDDAAAAEEGQAEQPKPKKTARERIDELTAARREAEREAEYWRAKALQPAQEARRPQAEAATEEPEPDPADYEYGELDVNFIRDIARHEMRREFREELAQRDMWQSVQTRLEAFNRKVVEQFPDGEPDGLVALRALPSLSQAVTDVILASDNGPKLADHLGKNPRELNRLSALPPHLQAYELAKIETRLSATPAAKTATDAPPPTPQVRGAGGRFSTPPDTTDFAAFDKAYGN